MPDASIAIGVKWNLDSSAATWWSLIALPVLPHHQLQWLQFPNMMEYKCSARLHPKLMAYHLAKKGYSDANRVFAVFE